MMKKLVVSEFPLYTERANLFLRIIFGLLLVHHGWDKIIYFDTYVTDFPDPLGLEQQPSLLLAIFAEFFCGILLTVGFLVRLAAVPIVTTFLVAFFVVHAGDPFQQKELALLYLLLGFYFLLKGAGSASVDKVLFQPHHEHA